MTGALRLVLGDQLSPGLAGLADLDRARDVVLMAEVDDEATYVRHHPKKIAFVLSAMRHFAEELRGQGVRVAYVTLDDPANTGALGSELARWAGELAPERIVLTEPGEWRLRQAMEDWRRDLGPPVEIRADDRFLCATGEFADWSEGRRQLRMETFYREMRRRHGLLMDAGGEPEGGRWNFDAENRRRLPDDVRPPAPLRFAPDATTRAVLELVGRRYGHHFGELEPFAFAVTRADAERAFGHFLRHALPFFGDYQDAMRRDEPWLFHSVVSAYLNVGLLDPLAMCRAVEAAWRSGNVPLNAAEGYIRQILGWREYVRGIYWTRMPDYAGTNALDAQRPLPGFYWSGETEMACLAQAIGQTRREAYAHHIQRLMVTGNFALLIGALPEAVCRWYLEVYVDAFEWVELPNTHGMALFADGGVMASKPYAAGGNYISKMSDYCRGCRYDVRRKSGPDACPFNYLYWDFLARNGERLSRNPRLAMPYRSLRAMDAARRREIARDASRFLDGL